jgi:siroheme synthase
MGIVYVASEGSLAFLAKNGFRTSVVVALSSAHALALYSNIEFFTKRGHNIGFFDALSLRGAWWWNSWSSPNWVFIFGVISFIFFIKSALDFLSNSITVEL